jgi:CHAD domain-containing protein
MPQPVSVLLRQSLLLKAAVLDCLSDDRRGNQDPKPVHRLRSATRRIEATLELLSLYASSLPELQQQTKPLAKVLRRVRRAAARVRDLDVHLDLLESYQASPDAPRLRKILAGARKKAARQLQDSLKKDRRRVGRKFDNLEAALEPAHDLTISGGTLADVALHWLAAAVRGLDPLKDEDLHAVRKASKTARYLAEIGAPNSKAAAVLASRFERVQQTLGAWHDSLLLEQEALASLGEDAPIVAQIQAETLQLRQKAVARVKLLPRVGRTAPRSLLN